jgi:hypothetical protein
VANSSCLYQVEALRRAEKDDDEDLMKGAPPPGSIVDLQGEPVESALPSDFSVDLHKELMTGAPPPGFTFDLRQDEMFNKCERISRKLNRDHEGPWTAEKVKYALSSDKDILKGIFPYTESRSADVGH